MWGGRGGCTAPQLPLTDQPEDDPVHPAARVRAHWAALFMQATHLVGDEHGGQGSLRLLPLPSELSGSEAWKEGKDGDGAFVAAAGAARGPAPAVALDFRDPALLATGRTPAEGDWSLSARIKVPGVPVQRVGG